jgi:ABC-type Mn2+/Zn2+ transport system ATPase subunit
MTAQALLGTPELIVLDEPTSEVDYAASRRFWAAFRERGKSAALVIATHDVELALTAADAILLLQKEKPAHLAPVPAFTRDELSIAIGEG